MMEKMVVTGGAGFIGSNLGEHLAARQYQVALVDDFSTGREENLSGWAEKENVEVVRADINDTERMTGVFTGAKYVFHQAAIPSVPRSIDDPEASNLANICGTLSVLVAARDAKVQRVVAASSSSIYGDNPDLPKREDRRGKPLSPYALTKVVTEEYCRLFYKIYGLETVCLRYFNVFGPRQNPKSQYAAVIPRFITRILSGEPPIVFGDGEQTRDFTFISNVIDANWIAATHPKAAGEAFNIGCGNQTSLNQLLGILSDISGREAKPTYEPARTGDVKHSVADVAKARGILGYSPAVSLDVGLERVFSWYRSRLEGMDDAP
jgi:UDP-glucose 4-epimerase